MKKITIAVFLSFALVGILSAEDYFSVPHYYAQSDFLNTTPGVESGVYGSFFNPAVLGMFKGFEMRFAWNDLDRQPWERKNWMYGFAASNIGFSAQNWTYGFPLGSDLYDEKSFTDYNIGLGFGNKRDAFGIGYTWSKGDIPYFDPRDDMLSLGWLTRPCRYVSLGFVDQFALHEKDHRTLIDLGVRPLGNPSLTLFGDFVWNNYDKNEKILWGAGVGAELIPGIMLHGKYFENETFQFGLSLAFGNLGATTSFHYNDESNRTYNTYGVSLGLVRPSVFTSMVKKDRYYVKMDFNDALKYQKYAFFDSGKTLIEVLEFLEEVKNDDRVAGLALRITEEMYGSWELVWEVREKIKEVQAAGKTVYVFFERGTQRHYYLASVADKIMVDPQSFLLITGFNMGRTYYRNLADKLGIGVDEWRYFTYKSAFESFSRTNMSEADREQRKALADDWYSLMRADICQSREISESDFDYIVDEVAILVADSLLQYNLADTVGRWSDMTKWIEEDNGKDKLFTLDKAEVIEESVYNAIRYQDLEWGRPPQIAVIYALGGCELNSGINARRLQREISRAREDKNIKAIVLRADSPGGDILPSDIVAQEIKKTTEKKPVIVSQGWVAGSGGYWISMYGDKIVASPWTITGSIGVIGGMVYNNGFGDKIGFTYDHTQAGKHADVFGGISMPLLGTLPERNLTNEEREAVGRMIKLFYKQFVTMVAEGRNMTYDEVDAIGQGRVWTGLRGVDNGLVDELGGLEKALDLAKEAAGIPPERKIEIVEMPEKGMFNFEVFQPKLFGADGTLFSHGISDPRTTYLKMLLEAKGRPLALLPPEYYMLDD